MYVYRNIAWKHLAFDEQDYSKTNCIEELEPEEYMLLELLPCMVWRAEKEIPISCRNSGSFFSEMSDDLIFSILDKLVEYEKVSKRYVKTDLPTKTPPNYDEVFTTSTDDFPRVFDPKKDK